jgi:Ankyrin repeats (3 copies)
MELLIASGANATATDKEGWTPLHCAAAHNHTSCVGMLLLLNNVSPNCTTCDGRTPLHVAAPTANEATLTLLLEKGANPALLDNAGATCLHYAAESTDWNCEVVFLSSIVPVYCVDNQGRTPLGLALEFGQTLKARQLIQAETGCHAMLLSIAWKSQLQLEQSFGLTCRFSYYMLLAINMFFNSIRALVTWYLDRRFRVSLLWSALKLILLILFVYYSATTFMRLLRI